MFDIFKSLPRTYLTCSVVERFNGLSLELFSAATASRHYFLLVNIDVCILVLFFSGFVRGFSVLTLFGLNIVYPKQTIMIQTFVTVRGSDKP